MTISVIVIAVIVFCILAISPIILETWHSKQMTKKLLYETNHSALYAACKQVMQEVKDGRLESGKYYNNSETSQEPNLNILPKIIADLNPTYVEISDGGVLIELEGGWTHSGARAFDDPNVVDMYSDYIKTNIKLTNGLWYFNDEFFSNPKWREKIGACIKRMQQKNK